MIYIDGMNDVQYYKFKSCSWMQLVFFFYFDWEFSFNWAIEFNSPTVDLSTRIGTFLDNRWHNEFYSNITHSKWTVDTSLSNVYCVEKYCLGNTIWNYVVVTYGPIVNYFPFYKIDFCCTWARQTVGRARLHIQMRSRCFQYDFSRLPNKLI